jgi:muramoyltetrapeptide carboxypeptidase
MIRRSFIKKTGAVSSLLPFAALLTSAQAAPPELLIPAPLQPGDTIGLVTPATYITEEQLEQAVQQFESFGFKVKWSPNMLVRKGFLAGTDAQRVDDLHNMFSNEDIKAIFCGRGGYGSARLLPMLNYDLIRDNPKIFMGFSDITALLFGVHQKTGLRVYHGPMGTSDYTAITEKYFRKFLIGNPKEVLLHSREDENQMEVIRPGKASGGLIGGNLSLLVALVGTPYDISYENKVVFIEEVGEAPYRVDRMLTQLITAENKLQSAAAIVLGDFSDCDTDTPEKSLSLDYVLHDRLGNLNVPVVRGIPFGHEADNITFPFGANAEVDTAAGTIKVKLS